jgi:hypothetical protein
MSIFISGGSGTTGGAGGTGASTVNDQGKYNATPPTLSDGTRTDLQLDVNGSLKVVEQYAAAAEDNSNGVLAIQLKPLATATYAPSLYTNFGSSVTANIKNGAGTILSASIYNTQGTACFLQFYNSTSTTATVFMEVPVAATSGFVALGQDFFTLNGVYCSTGITFGVSTTSGSYTGSTIASAHNIQVLYK